MAEHNCEQCPIRVKYDKSPKSLVGRFWRWHINFCPGWKGYMRSLDEEKRALLVEKYQLSNLA